MARRKSTPKSFAAFQFYPRDWLASSKVSRMNLEQVGAYFILLCYAWLDDGLSPTLADLAKLVRLPLRRFEKIWAGVLSECFVLEGGKLKNPRQERTRKELVKYVKSCAKGGKASAATRSKRYGTSKPLHSHFGGHFEVKPEVNVNTASALALASSSASSKEESTRTRAPASPEHAPRRTRKHGTPEGNYKLIVALIHRNHILDTFSEDEWPEAVKVACAQEKIAYDSRVVIKAIEAASRTVQ